MTVLQPSGILPLQFELELIQLVERPCYRGVPIASWPPSITGVFCMLSKDDLRKKLVSKIHEWVLACEDQATDTVILHQDAFAADHQEEEIRLLGWAIKYADFCGKNVMIVTGKPN